jgi:hypothetical protein
MHNRPTATMGRVKCREPAADRVNDIWPAKCACHTSEVTSRCAEASSYGIQYGTLRDHLRGPQLFSVVNEKEQLLTPDKENSIVRLCEALDDLGH